MMKNTQSVDDNLPLLDLFTRLREAGLPLGIGEYQLLLRALGGGFGVSDRADLKRLCQTLWIKSREYFPVTRRQMKQNWRYLRRPVREGIPTELDIEATVNQIGQQGVLLEPVLLPPRINQSELLLLIDQDGSMVPFHSLSRRLAETAVRGGRLGKAGIYYFHNCPNLIYDDCGFNSRKARRYSPNCRLARRIKSETLWFGSAR